MGLQGKQPLGKLAPAALARWRESNRGELTSSQATDSWQRSDAAGPSHWQQKSQRQQIHVLKLKGRALVQEPYRHDQPLLTFA